MFATLNAIILEIFSEFFSFNKIFDPEDIIESIGFRSVKNWYFSALTFVYLD